VGDKELAHHFSLRTPLNFFAAFFFLAGFFTAMNSPDVLLRFVQALTPPSFVLSWLRFFTAPLRALSPTGLLTAMVASSFDDNARQKNCSESGTEETDPRYCKVT
jgi:hypothetical protein